MSYTRRIGTQVWPADPFWVQVQDVMQQHARQHAVDLVSIVTDNLRMPTDEDLIIFTEEVLAQDLDALIAWNLPQHFIHRILDLGLPVVHLTETDLRHPRLVSPLGLHAIATDLGNYIVQHLRGHGTVLAVGGMLGDTGDDGRSRLAGIRTALEPHPALCLQHIASFWDYDQSYAQCYAALQHRTTSIDAIFGFSDPIALAARDAGRALGVVHEHTLVVGINGDPLALAAIADGSMTATMRTPAATFGSQALDLAIRAANGVPVPQHFGFQPHLVTAANVTAIAAQQLFALASLPNRLIDVSHQQEQRRLVQLETSLEINRRAGLIADRQRLAHEIAELIRTNYGYDEAQLLLWNVHEQVLVLEPADTSLDRRVTLRADASPVLHAALERNEPIFLPDTRHSHRFIPDPAYPTTRSRVVIPIRLSGHIIGLLDLHSYHSTHHTHHELVGLQMLADQLGIAMRNAELYEDAVQARARAEKTDQFKTRLLANVSHEFRTPLNVILGYSQAALQPSNTGDIDLPLMLRRDLEHIYRSGEHLFRLVNDLLDLSRAEIDELELFPEPLATHSFLHEVFDSIGDHMRDRHNVRWRLALPARLPTVHADPVRLRQILFNLLHNAHKFTTSGEIVLGAEVLLPYMHIWVADTGDGIPIAQQERMFEPFVMGDERRHDGVGLGLSITQRLVALHNGTITLESQPGEGSTFHIYLPLPNLGGQPVTTFLPVNDARADVGATDVLLKPWSGGKLIEAIEQLQPPAGAKSLLIVDDDPQAHDLYRRVIAQHLPQYALQGAMNGHEALAILQHETPSLIMLDLIMPVMDGFAVLEHVRATPHTRHVPVVIISGHVLAFEDIQRLNQAHVTFHSKDVLRDTETVALVQRALAQTDALPPQTSVLVKHAVAYVQQNYASTLSRQEIANAVGVHEDYLGRIFARELGMSPWEYLNRYRIKRAKELLRTTSAPIAAIATQVGFDAPAYFSRVFGKEVGCSPRQYREQLFPT